MKSPTDAQASGPLLAVISDVRIVNASYALYQIRCSRDGEHWSVWRRYKQFASLRARLVRAQSSVRLPSFPQRSFWTRCSVSRGRVAPPTSE